MCMYLVTQGIVHCSNKECIRASVGTNGRMVNSREKLEYVGMIEFGHESVINIL